MAKVIRREVELKNLLIHWWHYYGKGIYTLSELEAYKKLVDENEEKILRVAIASYICKDGSPTIILYSIRENKLEELFASLPDIDSFDENEQQNYKKSEREFLEKILKTYLLKFE